VEAVVFCGLQGAGKTTFYRERFLHTHVRISRDLLRTRHREATFLRACLETGQRFVVDNTNPTAADRRPYLEAALAHGFRPVAYLFVIAPTAALARNAEREGRARVPVKGVLGTAKRLEPPRAEEGFAERWQVFAAPGGGFRVEPLEGGTATPPPDAHYASRAEPVRGARRRAAGAGSAASRGAQAR